MQKTQQQTDPYAQLKQKIETTILYCLTHQVPMNKSKMGFTLATLKNPAKETQKDPIKIWYIDKSGERHTTVGNLVKDNQLDHVDITDTNFKEFYGNNTQAPKDKQVSFNTINQYMKEAADKNNSNKSQQHIQGTLKTQFLKKQNKETEEQLEESKEELSQQQTQSQQKMISYDFEDEPEISQSGYDRYQQAERFNDRAISVLLNNLSIQKVPTIFHESLRLNSQGKSKEAVEEFKQTLQLALSPTNQNLKSRHYAYQFLHQLHDMVEENLKPKFEFSQIINKQMETNTQQNIQDQQTEANTHQSFLSRTNLQNESFKTASGQNSFMGEPEQSHSLYGNSEQIQTGVLTSQVPKYRFDFRDPKIIRTAIIYFSSKDPIKKETASNILSRLVGDIGNEQAVEQLEGVISDEYANDKIREDAKVLKSLFEFEKSQDQFLRIQETIKAQKELEEQQEQEQQIDQAADLPNLQPNIRNAPGLEIEHHQKLIDLINSKEYQDGITQAAQKFDLDEDQEFLLNEACEDPLALLENLKYLDLDDSQDLIPEEELQQIRQNQRDQISQYDKNKLALEGTKNKMGGQQAQYGSGQQRAYNHEDHDQDARRQNHHKQSFIGPQEPTIYDLLKYVEKAARFVSNISGEIGTPYLANYKKQETVYKQKVQKNEPNTFQVSQLGPFKIRQC